MRTIWNDDERYRKYWQYRPGVRTPRPTSR